MGRSTIPESEPVGPVSEEHIDAVIPRVGARIAAKIQIQRFTGMQSGEVVLMKSADIDRSSTVWVYRPESHETEHHGKSRQILIGPRTQAVLAPWLRDDPSAYLFNLKEAMEELRAAQRRQRRSRVQPSQRDRRKRGPKRVPGLRYTCNSDRRAIIVVCHQAGISSWHPDPL
jgi:integrase